MPGEIKTPEEQTQVIQIPFLPNQVDLLDVDAEGNLILGKAVPEIVEKMASLPDARHPKQRPDLPYGNYSIIKDGNELFAIYKGAKSKRQLGQGGYGKVKLAIKIADLKSSDENSKTKVGEWVALKVMEKEKDAELEVKVGGALGRVIGKLAKKSPTSKSNVLMRYVPGVELARYLQQKNKQLSARECYDLCINMTAALQEIHTKYKYIHRDIKPGNCIRGPNGEITIIDVGPMLHKGEEKEARSSWAFGTSGYRAPELEQTSPYYIQGKGVVYTDQADIYSLGVSLQNIVGCMQPTTLPADLNALLANMINPDPSKRPALDEVIKTLQELQNLLPEKNQRSLGIIELGSIPPYIEGSSFEDYLQKNKQRLDAIATNLNGAKIDQVVLIQSPEEKALDPKQLIAVKRAIESRGFLVRNEVFITTKPQTVPQQIADLTKKQGLPQLDYTVKITVSKLYIAIHEKDISQVKHLLENKENADAVIAENWSPIHIAVGRGAVNIVALLLEHKADINAAGNNGLTPLHIAANNSNAEIVKYLLEQKAEVNKETKDGMTALYMAITQGNVDIAKLLVQYGAKADINAATDNGLTPLHIAVNNDNTEMVKYLLEQKAEVNKEKKYGRTALHTAVAKGNLDIAKLLVQYGAKTDINAATDNGLTPLHIAVNNNNAEMVKYLLEQKAEANKETTDGITALHMAVAKGNLDLVKLLVQYGADVTLTNKDNHSPIYSALKQGHTAIAQHLVETSKNYYHTETTTDNFNLLHAAAHLGNIDFAKFLIEKNVDINTKDKNGNLPLHTAIQTGQLDMVPFLIENKADLHHLNKDGLSPLNAAIALYIKSYLQGNKKADRLFSVLEQNENHQHFVNHFSEAALRVDKEESLQILLEMLNKSQDGICKKMLHDTDKEGLNHFLSSIFFNDMSTFTHLFPATIKAMDAPMLQLFFSESASNKDSFLKLIKRLLNSNQNDIAFQLIDVAGPAMIDYCLDELTILDANFLKKIAHLSSAQTFITERVNEFFSIDPMNPGNPAIKNRAELITYIQALDENSVKKIVHLSSARTFITERINEFFEVNPRNPGNPAFKDRSEVTTYIQALDEKLMKEIPQDSGALVHALYALKNQCSNPDDFSAALTTFFFEKQFRDQGTTLDFSSSNIEDQDIPKLMLYLNENPQIKKLILSDNQLTFKGAQLLAECKTISSLDLSSQDIRDAGAIALAQNKNFKELSLIRCSLTNLAAQALAKTSGLQTLNLAWNRIDYNGATKLLKNKSLTTLDLTEADVHPNKQKKLALSEKVKISFSTDKRLLKPPKKKHEEYSPTNQASLLSEFATRYAKMKVPDEKETTTTPTAPVNYKDLLLSLYRHLIEKSKENSSSPALRIIAAAEEKAKDDSSFDWEKCYERVKTAALGTITGSSLTSIGLFSQDQQADPCAPLFKKYNSASDLQNALQEKVNTQVTQTPSNR